MTHTPPSEAAASSQSPYLDPNFLESSARCDCGQPQCVLAAEVLRLRAQCPPTVEVEQMRADLAQLREAIGLMTTAKPDMLVDVRDPIGMARQVVEMVERMRQDWLTTFDASIEQKKRAEKAEAIAEQNGKAATERGDLIERLRGILFCTFPAEPTLEEQAKAMVAAAKNGAPPVVSYDRLFMVHLPGEWSSSADEFFVYRRVSNTPWVTVHWRHGPGISNSRPENTEKADGFPSEFREACMTFDTFLRRCGFDVSKLEGLMPVWWVIEAAKLLREPVVAIGGSLTDEARTAVAAIRDLGPELAKAGIQVGPRCSHAEAVAQLRGARDRWRERFEAADKESGATAKRILAMCDLLAEAGFSWTGAESHAAGLRNAVNAALAELARLRKESKRDQVAKQQALLDEIARLFPGKGPLLERVRAAAKPAPSAWRERFMRLRDGIKAQIAWCTLPGGAPFAGMHKEHAALSCALANADALLKEAAGAGGSSWASGLSLFERRSCKEPKVIGEFNLLPSDATKRKCLVEELRQVVNRNSIEHACGDTPDFILAEVMVDAAFAFGKFTRSRDAHVGGRSFSNPGQPFDPSDPIGPKFAPATGQPRTEVPVGPDGSGTVVELGEVFRREMLLATTSHIAAPVFGETLTDVCLRHLHAAVAELAKVVERGGAK